MENTQAVSSQAGVIERYGRKARAVAAFKFPWHANEFVEMYRGVGGRGLFVERYDESEPLDACRFVVYRRDGL